jgi:hypothetical protein
MNSRNILYALIALAVLALVWVVVQRRPYTEPETESPLADMRAKLDPAAVATITMTMAEDAKALLKKEADAWILPDLYGYPAKKESVNELILTLRKIGEERLVAQNPESHSEFEVGTEKGKRVPV